MHLAFRALVALSLFVMGATLAPAAGAQDDERAQARQAFQRGVDAYAAERWEEALGAFQEAYRIAPHPSVRVNMANCYLHLGRPVEALDHFERFLIESGDDVDRAQKREVRGQIAELRGQIGEVFLRIQPEGSTVTIDGHTTRRAPILDAVKLSAGPHHLTVEMDGHQTREWDFEVEGGGRAEVRIVLEEGAEPAEAPVDDTIGAEAAAGAAVEEEGEAPEPLAEPPSEGFQIPTTAWIAGGATLALAITAGVLGGVAIGAEGDFDEAVTRSNDPSASAADRAAARQEGLDAADRADRLALTADILGATAVLAAGATVFLLFWDQDDDDGLALAPSAGPQGGGLMMRGSF